MKRCSRCKEMKELNEFTKFKIGEDGLRKYCKQCIINLTGVSPKDYCKTEEQKKDYRKRYTKKYIVNNKEKNRAHSSVGYAIKVGKIKKPNRCSHCLNKTCELDAHHEDYNNKLDVIWLCRFCHSELHRNTKETTCQNGNIKLLNLKTV